MKSIKNILKDDNVKSNINNVIVWLILLALIVAFHLNGYTTIALLISILGFIWVYPTLSVIIQWMFYWPLILYRVLKYKNILEEYNKKTNWRIWWDLTLWAFIIKDFVRPGIIYSCVDGKGLNLK